MDPHRTRAIRRRHAPLALTIAISEGDAGGDCRISASEKTFAKIVDGKQNPLTAYMTGKLKVHGDVGAALKLKHLLG